VTSIARCPSCLKPFDALKAGWCACVAKQPSPVCPSCSTCLCKLPSAKQSEFWINAPEQLLRQRASASSRRLIREVDAGGGDRRRVLIVDDDESIRLIAAFRVETMGFDVATASNAREALELLDRQWFDVVITDALMPGMDGRDLCRRIKNRQPSIRVIVMTSLYTAARYKMEAHRQFGADEYLTKPIEFGVLQRALERLSPGQMTGTAAAR
jgi:CheY-like chemotaxis protein